MTIWGKLLGAAAGLAAGGPLGALLGGVAGHIYDKWRDERKQGPEAPEIEDQGWQQDPLEAKRALFATAVVVLAAKLAKADGVVTRDEVEAFKEHFDVRDDEVGNVAALFNEAKRDPGGFEPIALQVADTFAYEPAVLEEILDGLFVVAAADGTLKRPELLFLAQVASIFGFSQAEFDAIRARYEAARQRQQRGRRREQAVGEAAGPSPYAVLGVDPKASEEEIRRRYRELVREHHPDRLIAKGMPEEFIKQANDKLAAINTAYDRIAKERGF